jgi:hypothetical protein
VPALDLGRGWRAFRVIENDPQGVAIAQTILKAGRVIGACGTFAVFEIIMTCSKLKQGRQAEYDRRTALAR